MAKVLQLAMQPDFPTGDYGQMRDLTLTPVRGESIMSTRPPAVPGSSAGGVWSGALEAGHWIATSPTKEVNPWH
jgi:hypothetical protein